MTDPAKPWEEDRMDHADCEQRERYVDTLEARIQELEAVLREIADGQEVPGGRRFHNASKAQRIARQALQGGQDG